MNEFFDVEEFSNEIAGWSDSKLLNAIKKNDEAWDSWFMRDNHHGFDIFEIDAKYSCFYDEIVKRYSDYVENKSVTLVKPVKKYRTASDLERRYCRKCKIKFSDFGCVGCPIYNRLCILKEEAAVSDDLMAGKSDVSV